MSKVNYSNTNGGYNLAVINQNFVTTASILNSKVLWRDNPSGEPNQMLNTFDMNSNRIINLPEPVSGSEPLRKQDLQDFITNGLGIITSGFGQVVSTVAAIRSLSHFVTKQVVATGYYQAGDLGGGVYVYDSTDVVSSDNGGTVIVAIDGGRWKLQHHGSVSAAQFGAKCDGVTNDYAAINTGINAAGVQELVIPGMCGLSQGIVNMPNNKKFRGLNRDTCGFIALTAGLHLIEKTAPSIFTDGHNIIEELQFNNNGFANTAGIVLTLCFQMTVRRCKFVGCTSPLFFDRGYYFNVHDNHLEPNAGGGSNRTGGFTFTSTTDTEYIFVVNVRGTTHFNNGNGIVVGSAQYFWRRAIDSSVSDSQTFALTNGTDLAYWTIIENDCQNVRYCNSSVENSTSSIIIRTGTGINVQPSFTKFIHVDCDQAFAGHIVHAQGIGTQYIGGSLTSSGIGLNFNAAFITGGDQFNFDGTMFHGYTTNPGGAVSLQNCTNIKIVNCNINLCYNGITVGSGVTGLRMHGNSYLNGAGGSALNGSPVGAGNYLHDNYGFTIPGLLTASAPSSGVPFTNLLGYDGVAYVTGGTVTLIQVNGVTTGLSSGAFSLRNGDSITITYSVTPTFVVIGQS